MLSIWFSNLSGTLMDKATGCIQRCIPGTGGRTHRYFLSILICEQLLRVYQMILPIGCSLVPILITSDQTCLTNFSSDKKLWPIFMTWGNILSDIRSKPSTQAWILIGLLPISLKRTKSRKGFTVQNQGHDSLETQQRLIERIL